jgi:hypothetical protein
LIIFSDDGTTPFEATTLYNLADYLISKSSAAESHHDDADPEGKSLEYKHLVFRSQHLVFRYDVPMKNQK